MIIIKSVLNALEKSNFIFVDYKTGEIANLIKLSK
jgi:hypothetical protein